MLENSLSTHNMLSTYHLIALTEIWKVTVLRSEMANHHSSQLHIKHSYTYLFSSQIGTLTKFNLVALYLPLEENQHHGVESFSVQ